MVNGYFLNIPIEFSQNKLMTHFKNFLINFYNFYYKNWRIRTNPLLIYTHGCNVDRLTAIQTSTLYSFLWRLLLLTFNYIILNEQ